MEGGCRGFGGVRGGLEGGLEGFEERFGWGLEGVWRALEGFRGALGEGLEGGLEVSMRLINKILLYFVYEYWYRNLEMLRCYTV